MFHRISGGIAALAILVLGTMSLWAAPGPDLGVAIYPQTFPEGPGLVFSNSAGKLLCHARLHLRIVPATDAIDATFDNGRLVKPAVTRNVERPGWVIVDLGAAQQTASSPDLFEWRPGARLNVRAPRAQTLEYGGWEIHTEDRGVDSSSLQTWRHWHFWTGVLFTIVGGLCGFYVTVWPPRQARLVNAESCVSDMIESMDDTHRKVEKQFLRRLLVEGAGRDEAWACTGLDQKQQPAFFFKTAKEFRERLDNLIRGLLARRAMVRFRQSHARRSRP